MPVPSTMNVLAVIDNNDLAGLTGCRPLDSAVSWSHDGVTVHTVASNGSIATAVKRALETIHNLVYVFFVSTSVSGKGLQSGEVVAIHSSMSMTPDGNILGSYSAPDNLRGWLCELKLKPVAGISSAEPEAILLSPPHGGMDPHTVSDRNTWEFYQVMQDLEITQCLSISSVRGQAGGLKCSEEEAFKRGFLKLLLLADIGTFRHFLGLQRVINPGPHVEVPDENAEMQHTTPPAKETSPPNECDFCLLNEVEAVVVPCGLELACKACSSHFLEPDSKCPVCKGPVKAVAPMIKT